MKSTAIARMGLGTAPLGGLFAEVSPQAATDTVDAAWGLGVRFFDTAPLYGSGLAEERLGQALTCRPREEYTVSTKVGRVLQPGAASPEFRGAPPFEAVFDFSVEGVRRSLAGSLRRLRLDAVDVLLLHDPEDHMEEARHAVETMREIAPRIGVGTNVVETAITFVERGDADVVILAGRYTLLDRSAAEELLPLCAERGVELLAAGIFNSGILAGSTTFDYQAAAPAVLERRRRLEQACACHDVPLAAAAIQFPLRHPAVTSILVGARTPEEITEDVRLLDHPVPEELWSELDSESE
jgi:D-threo-aldose 1-dehydrogenase